MTVKVITLDTCDFPIAKGDVAGYTVLHLPEHLRKLFDERGADVVRINSLKVARTIPDFGGKGSGEDYSLLPHQDHLDPHGDARRFLMLTKLSEGARGSSTLMMKPQTAASMIPLEEVWLRDDARRAIIARERKYDVRFRITEEQYHRCFDEKGGYEHVVTTVTGKNATHKRALAVRLGILNYLIRGPHTDEVMRDIVKKFEGAFIEERWDQGGIVILDNPKIFHARFGGNTPPLQRNFCI